MTEKRRRIHLQVRPTIGVLVDWLEDKYQIAVTAGAADAAQARDANLICVAGGALELRHNFLSQRNVLYDLVSAENVDGLVIIAGVLGNFVAPDRIQRFCERYRPLPVVSIALELPGIPCVLVDNDTGMRQLVRHLIEMHGYRRIAFMHGPADNREAETRYRVYVETLTEHGLEIDRRLETNGDFMIESGARAVRELLDGRGANFEALIAANDNMALGALDFLQARGLRVPDDVAVVGFDDIEDAIAVTPPLTTVRQPLYEQGAKAVEMALALVYGEPAPERLVLPTTLVVRRSCGCFSQATLKAGVAAVRLAEAAPRQADWAADLRRRQPMILVELCRAVGLAVDSQMTAGFSRLLEALVADLHQARPGAFLTTFDEMLRQAAVTGGEMTVWQEVLSALRSGALASVSLDLNVWARAESLWQQARVLVSEMAERARAYQLLRTQRQTRLLSDWSRALITQFDVAGLMDVVARGLPLLEVHSCYLALYENPEMRTQALRLMLAYTDERRVTLAPDGLRYPASQMVPREFLPCGRRYTMLVEPLYFREEQLGVVVFEMSPRRGAMYEILHEQISSALKGALLVQEGARREKELEMRAVELARSNTELERFAYVASHDLQEPLRMVASYTQLLARRYRGRLDADADEFIGYAVEGVHYMQQLINDLLAYSHAGRDEYATAPIDSGAVLAAVCADLAPEIEAAGARVEVVDGPLPVVFVGERQLAQLWHNLLRNALKFRSPERPLRVGIGARRQVSEWLFWVGDNGIGFEPQYAERIFVIFQRLHTKADYPGSGVGLAVCKRIVEQYGGRIWAESQPNSGSTFYFTLPAQGGQ